MVAEAPGVGQAAGRGHAREPLQAWGAHRADDDLRHGIALANRLRGGAGEGAVFPAPSLGAIDGNDFAVGVEALPGSAVGLVPYLVVPDAAPVARDGRGDVAVPGEALLFCDVGWTSRGAEDARGIGVVEAVAIAEADPGTASGRNDVVYDVVEPGEVIDAALALGAGPPRLDADPLDARGLDIVVGGGRVEDVAVEFLEAEADGRFDDLARRDMAKGADSRKTEHGRSFHPG